MTNYMKDKSKHLTFIKQHVKPIAAHSPQHEVSGSAWGLISRKWSES